MAILLSQCSLLVLHPRHKLRYFKNAGWDDTRITIAENIVQATFEDMYKSSQSADAQSSSSDNVRIPMTIGIGSQLY